jgi:hypothetical protein
VNRISDIKIAPELLLRLGLAFVLLYAAAASLLDPFEWVGFLPSFVGNVVDPMLALKAFAAYEAVLGLWLLSGRYRKYAAAVTALTLAGITLANAGELIITFRDIGLLFAALALFFSAERQ